MRWLDISDEVVRDTSEKMSREDVMRVSVEPGTGPTKSCTILYGQDGAFTDGVGYETIRLHRGTGL